MISCYYFLLPFLLPHLCHLILTTSKPSPLSSAFLAIAATRASFAECSALGKAQKTLGKSVLMNYTSATSSLISTFVDHSTNKSHCDGAKWWWWRLYRVSSQLVGKECSNSPFPKPFAESSRWHSAKRLLCRLPYGRALRILCSSGLLVNLFAECAGNFLASAW